MRTILLGIITLVLAACSSPQSETSGAEGENSQLTLYQAKAVLTQNKDASVTSAVIVDDAAGLIVETGDFKALKKKYRGAAVDTSFKNKTILPGLIDPHVHMTLGAMMYGLDWVPPWDMPSPKGLIKGLPNKASLMERIAELEANAPDGPLILFGYHNLVQGDIDRKDLDSISTTRPIFIWHYSGHDFYLNSPAIGMSKLTPELAKKYHGVDLDETGELTGRIYEDAALALFASIGPILLAPTHIAKGFDGYEKLLTQGGVTTVAEMGYGIFGRQMEDVFFLENYKVDAPYNIFLVPEHRAFKKEHGENAWPAMRSMISSENRIPVLNHVKLFTDAAFYSQTMKMKPPGYLGGQSKGTDGLWVTEPEELPDLLAYYWERGMDIHIHSNGDAAQDSTLSAVATLPDGLEGQRVILEHVGQMTPAQIEMAKDLPIGISAASHYVNYMGEDYITAIGDKVANITPLASTMAAGLPTTVHSDAPLAPPMPLQAASVHATRLTRQGNVSTPSERLTPEQALRAITIEAAWSLGMEDEIGSIESGKRADFTIIDSNPLDVDPKDWGAIKVWGVVLGGNKHPIISPT